MIGYWLCVGFVLAIALGAIFLGAWQSEQWWKRYREERRKNHALNRAWARKDRELRASEAKRVALARELSEERGRPRMRLLNGSRLS